MGTKNARKYSNGARAYTPRLSTTERRDTKASHALRQDRFRQVALTGLASESVHKFDGETVSFYIIFQFQVPPKKDTATGRRDSFTAEPIFSSSCFLFI